ncbi:MAG: energy transducer TonB [Nitrospirae bacterium]|nr:energy transducer TonB [Nitrospirota bacterium]
MTAAGPQHSGFRKGSHVQGWVVSLLLHGAVVLGAILLMKQIQLATQEKPFKWDVSLVSPTEPVTPEASPSSQAQAQPAPAPSLQQTVPAQQPQSPQPPAPQTTPSITERTVTPVVPKTPVSPPPQPAEPIKHETVAPMVTEAPAVRKPTEAPVTVPAKPAAQTPPPAPPAILEQTAKPDVVPTQTAAIAPAPANEPTKRDYGWLSEAILRRVEELKRYPAAARIDRAEGRVVVKAVINEDGSVGEIEVAQSSGFPSLDKAAMETIRQAAPFHLPHPLGRPRLTIKIPISYRLDR